MGRVWLFVAVIFAGGEAAAGAWPQPPGGGFVSLGYEVTTTREALSAQGREDDPAPDVTGYRTLYAEYGITPRFTAGLDLGGDEHWLSGRVNDEVERLTGQQLGLSAEEVAAYDATDRRVETWSGVAFLRYAIGPLDARHRWAAQLGVGRRSYEEPSDIFGLEEMREETIVRPLAAYGYGFAVERVAGWVSVEGSLELRTRTAGTPAKLDATLGLKQPEGDGRLSYLFQVQSGDYPGTAPYVRLVPGVVTKIWRGVSLETSVIYGIEGDDSVGAKVAIWIDW